MLSEPAHLRGGAEQGEPYLWRRRRLNERRSFDAWKEKAVGYLRSMERREQPGASLALLVLQHFDMLNYVAAFEMNGQTVEVPMWRRVLDQVDVVEYKADFLRRFAAEIATLPGPVTLLDVGAGIGLVSVKLAAMCDTMARIAAFDPDPYAAAMITRNLARLPMDAQLYRCAAGCFNGRGAFRTPPGDAARFLARAYDGPIRVVTLDSLPVDGALAMNIDVNGGELAILRGAEQTIRNAPAIIISLETHPRSRRRTGCDPGECLRLLSSWRPFQFSVAQTGAVLDATRPVLEQLPPRGVYNILCRSEE